MPALLPPDMQIGALPPGYSPLPPAGPALQYGFISNPPRLIQQVAGASSSAAPASFTLSGIAATLATSFLVALVSVAESAAATVSTPAGWTAVAGANLGNAGNTLGGRIFVLPGPNAGGFTSVAFTSLTGVNGIAVWFGEFANLPGAIDNGYSGNGTYSNGSTTPSAPNYVPTSGPVLLVGMESDVTGQAYTAANLPVVGSGGNWTAGTTATSTTGATNTIIRPFFALTDPLQALTWQIAGTLAGSIANGVSMVSLLAGVGGPMLQNAPQSDGVGAGVWTWGPLGNTKPGGAGSGQ